MPGLYGMPGMAAIRNTVETNLIWGGDANQTGVLTMATHYSSTILDAVASPTTSIRAGLLVAKETSGDNSGEYTEWDADATDGSQDLGGVVANEFSTLDEDGTATDRFHNRIIRAPLVAGSLLIQGAALVGHQDEFLARKALHAMNCVLDDDPAGWLAGANWRQKIHTGDLTLTSADNATRYLCHSADCNFTMPTAKDGLIYRFFMGENFELAVTSSSLFVVGGDQTADTVTWTTTGEQIGLDVTVECLGFDIAGTVTPTWHVRVNKTPFSTDDFLAHTIGT